MKPLLIFLFAVVFTYGAEGGLVEHPLVEVKASIQLPDGWRSSQENDDGVFVYRLAREGEPEKSGAASITLSVTTKVPDRTGQSPSEYASALIDMSQDEETPAPAQKGSLNGFPSLRSEYELETDTGKVRAVNVALANDKTGTLYFFAWQSALDESAELEALREKILSSIKIDPTF